MHLIDSLATATIIALVASTVSFGCADKQVEPRSVVAPIVAQPPPPPVVVRAQPPPAVAAVVISDEIIQACGIAAPDAHFAFDSSLLSFGETQGLDQVASCFMDGPLKGRTVKLVGRADPRGTEDYNLTLGQSRADSVRRYLESRGLARLNSTSSSRGAKDAIGSDESSWAADRRVDVLLSRVP